MRSDAGFLTRLSFVQRLTSLLFWTINKSASFEYHCENIDFGPLSCAPLNNQLSISQFAQRVRKFDQVFATSEYCSHVTSTRSDVA
jgi:hypothetical protein